MKLYHRTDHTKAIIQEGFKDATGTYLTNREFTGVWLSDVPLDANEGATGDDLLMIEIPERVLVPYEWIEEFKSYREFLIPAKIVNKYGPPQIVREDFRRGAD